jgi:hypothetical protein
MCWPSTETGPAVIPGLDPARYRRHAIHGEDRTWAETNCYTDLLVEVVHALGHEPEAMLGFTLAIDFEGDQWTFFKPRANELSELYGMEVQELALWRPLADHFAEQVEAGHLLLAEVDSFFLPDTAGTAYRATHTKTTIGVNAIDGAGKRLGYFHNAGYFLLEGEDYDELLQTAGLPHARVLPPYVEFVKFREDFPPPRGDALTGLALDLLDGHLDRGPRENPFPRFKARLATDLGWLLQADIERFHAYSFATLRQFGACYELAATHLDWLAARGVPGVADPAAALRELSAEAKATQFQLARSMARRKPLDLEPIDRMGALWQLAYAPLHARPHR